jgi:hypothetical protein
MPKRNIDGPLKSPAIVPKGFHRYVLEKSRTEKDDRLCSESLSGDSRLIFIIFRYLIIFKNFVVYWHDKGYSAKIMHQKLQARPVLTCPAYSSITNWIRAIDRREDIAMRQSGSSRLPDDRIDDAITEELEISPFHSVRSLASAIKRPRVRVWCHLHSMSFVIKYLRLVPHMLSPVQQNKRFECLIDLKRTLKLAKHRGWRYFLTGNKSLFYLTIDHEQIWMRAEV